MKLSDELRTLHAHAAHDAAAILDECEDFIEGVIVLAEELDVPMPNRAALLERLREDR